MFQPPGKERLWINSHGALTMASNLAPLDSSIDFAYPASVATMLAAGPTIQQHVFLSSEDASFNHSAETVAG